MHFCLFWTKKCHNTESLWLNFCRLFVVPLVRLTPIFGETAKQKKWGKSGWALIFDMPFSCIICPKRGGNDAKYGISVPKHADQWRLFSSIRHLRGCKNDIQKSFEIFGTLWKCRFCRFCVIRWKWAAKLWKVN